VSQAVREWVRVLKPEGKLILADSIAPEEPELDIFINELEVLRDSSHVRNHPISEWLTLLREAGLTPRLFRAWDIPLDVPSWTQRIQTPPGDVERIMQLLADASALARERFHIENINGSVSFTLPAALFVGVKSA
jgi:SAM-dependent methyltransferase